MIRNIVDFFKDNKGFIILAFVGLFTLGSMLLSNISETLQGSTQPPLSAPTAPVEPAPVVPEEEGPDFTGGNSELKQTEDMDTLMSDLAADAAMTVVGVGFGLEYYTNPEERLSRIRPITNTKVYNYFVRYYNNIDWEAANREKIEIFTDIEEMNFISFSNTGKADIEVKVRYYGDDNKTLINKEEQWFIVEVNRTTGFDAWIVTDIQERP